jgi:hypothetical protein
MPRPRPSNLRRLMLVVAATAAAAAAGCQGPAPSPITVDQPRAATTAVLTDPAPTDALGNPVGWTDCSNSVHRFKIGYPGGWTTAALGDDDRCELFDPAAFTVDGLPGLVTQQLAVHYFDDARSDFITEVYNPDFFRLDSHEDVTINGHHATKFTIATLPPHGPSGPTYPDGTLLYGYLIDDGARSIDLVTYVLPTATATRADRQHVVDQAITTVRFTA